MAKISVIIPVYNQASYLPDAIRSVYEQTNTEWELVVVDDGSTDETPQILASFQDSRVRVFRQAKRGVSAARNNGICQSSTPLIAFLDSDDLFMPDTLEVLQTYLKEHPEVGLVAGRGQRIDLRGRNYEEADAVPIKLEIPDLLFENDVPVDAVMIRREWLERVGGFDESMYTCEDWDLWLRLLVAGCRLSRVEGVLVSYRVHHGQVTGSAAKMRTGTLNMWKKFFNLPGLPSHIRAYQDRVVAAAFVRTSARAFRAGDFEMGNNDLFEAIRLDPSLTRADYKRLVDSFIGWAKDPQTKDSAAFLLSVSKHVSPKLPGFSLQIRKAIAILLLGPLFGASREVWRTHRKALIKAIWYDRSWLVNRGVLRMIVEAWFPLLPKRATAGKET